MSRLLIIRFEGVIYHNAQFNIKSSGAKSLVTERLNRLAHDKYVIVILRTDQKDSRPTVAQCQKMGVPQCGRHYEYVECYQSEMDILAKVKKLSEKYAIDLSDTFYCDCSEQAISLMSTHGAHVIPVMKCQSFDDVLERILPPQSKLTQTMFQLTEETPLLPRHQSIQDKGCVVS